MKAIKLITASVRWLKVTLLLEMVVTGRLGMVEKVLEDKEKHSSSFQANLGQQQ